MLAIPKCYNIYINLRHRSSNYEEKKINENVIGSMLGWGYIHGTIVIELAHGWRKKKQGVKPQNLPPNISNSGTYKLNPLP